MKNFLMAALGAVALMSSMTSCSSEEPTSPVTPNESTTVSFTGISPQGFHSRSGLEELMSRLICAVYDTDGNLVISKEYVDQELAAITSDGKFSVQFNLVKNGKYRVFFWSDVTSDGEKYDVDLTNHKVSTRHLDIAENDFFRAAFMYDDPTPIVPEQQTEYNITLRSPFAEVRLASNQMNTPTVKNLYPDGVYCVFGTPGTERWERSLPNIYDFWTGTASSDSDGLLDLCEFHQDYNNNIEGYATLFDHQFFVNRSGSALDASFALDDKPACDYQMQEGGGRWFKSVSIGQTVFKQNTRYTYLDNGGEGGDGGGGLFGSQTSFSVVVDDSFDSSAEIVL